MTDLLQQTWDALGDVLNPHGQAVNAVRSYAPSDYSIHFVLQIAIIILACRVVGWAGRVLLRQPQVCRRC